MLNPISDFSKLTHDTLGMTAEAVASKGERYAAVGEAVPLIGSVFDRLQRRAESLGIPQAQNVASINASLMGSLSGATEPVQSSAPTSQIEAKLVDPVVRSSTASPIRNGATTRSSSLKHTL